MMKKLVFAVALSLGTLTAFAQDTEEVQEEATEMVAEQDGFTEIAMDEVPAAITEALEAAHPGATINSAYVNEEAQYKLKVTKEDGEEVKLYADAEGNWLEM